MTGKTHLLTASMMGVMIAAKFDLHPVHVLVCAAGGLFPDTDQRKSYVGRVLPLWVCFKPHRRNLLHSPLGAALFSIPFLSPTLAALFFLGYISHLVLDSFNKMGVPWLYPKKQMIALARIRVGSKEELYVAIAFYMMVMAMLSIW